MIAGAIALAAVLLTARLEPALLAGVDEAAPGPCRGAGRSDRGGTVAGVLLPLDDDEVVHVWDDGRRLLATSVPLPDDRPLLPPPGRGQADVRTASGIALPGEEDEPFRVLTLPVTSPAGQRLVVQVGLPLHDAEESMRELTAALAVGAPS